MRDDLKFGMALGLMVALVVFGWLWTPFLDLLFFPSHTEAATSSNVTVSASVTDALACSTDVSTTAFGTLTSSAIVTSTTNASTSMTCTNSGNGCTLYLQSTGNGTNGGLWNSTSSALIESPDAAFNATATLVVNSEGFGVRAATTTVGSDAALGVPARFNENGSDLSGSVDIVGGLATTTLTLASSTSGATNREVVVTHKASVSSTTPGGNYDDTLTYSCLSN